MPARVLVFCTQPVPRTTVAELEAALRDADLLTLAEGHDLPEGEDAAVDEMWRHFRIDTSAASEVLEAELAWHGRAAAGAALDRSTDPRRAHGDARGVALRRRLAPRSYASEITWRAPSRS